MGKKLIKNYSFTPGPGWTSYVYPNALALLQLNKEFIQREIIGYINARIAANDAEFVGYVYDTDLCLRDSGYVLDAWIFDLKYGGNVATRKAAKGYWNGNVPVIDGTRLPEIRSYQFARDLINNYIFKNLPATAYQTAVDQVIDLTKTAESLADDVITLVSSVITTVITNGLSSIPAEIGGPGRIEVIGKWLLNEILLITNSTTNTVVFNFTDPTKGGEVEFFAGNSDKFPNAIQINNGVTTIYMNYSTSSMLSTHKFQIFVETSEIRVRPYDFGTDAIERMRVAQPQAMIDADFEYGLQPTKWQAIAVARGYPTTYEVLGTDIPVTSITTDASSGGGGIGSSLITVNSQSAHGLVIGDPFTIRALNSTVVGFNRAEGTFLVNTVPTTSSFTFYAKAKVGLSQNEVIGGSNVQLRKAAFYTGSELANPTISVSSNGSSGTFSTLYIVPSGSTVINFTGTAPSIGAPVSHPSIPSGTQTAGVFGTGGKVGDYRVKFSTISSDTTIYFADVTGLSSNMVLNNSGTQNAITSLTGDQATLQDQIGAAFKGDVEDYFISPVSVIGTGTNARFNISIGAAGVYTLGASNVPTGSGARFTITGNAGTYTIDSVTAGGTGYASGDVVKVLGSLLGGVDGTNDCRISITGVTGGAVTTAIVNPYNVSAANGTYTNQASIAVTGSGTLPAIQQAGTGYQQGDTIKILGTSLGGVTPDDDLYININTVSSGTVTAVTTAGGAHTTLTEGTYQNVSGTNSETIGTGILLSVQRNGGSYTAIPYYAGSGYNVGNRFTVNGADLGGTTPTNNLALYIDATTNYLPGGSYGQGGAYGLTISSGTAVRGDIIPVYSAISITAATTSSMGVASSVSFSAIATLQADFASAHGLVPGANILVSITSVGTNHALAAGPFSVVEVPSLTQIRWTARGTGSVQTSGITGLIYARPDAYFTHRPFDGGVQLSTGGPQHGAQAIRQSKKYIRYQSGKGAMYNTGALFAPSFDIRSAIASGVSAGSTITVVTDDVDHGLQVGSTVVIEGITTIGYDGEYVVTNIIDERAFTVEADLPLGSTSADIGSPCYAAMKYWSGAVVRSGIFDDQNGIFWQYDGREMAVGRRSSTFQLSGTITIAANSNAVIGNNTRFQDQLSAGDRIVLRGMTHVVTSISGQTSMTVSPDFRGVNLVSGVKIAKVIDIIIPQSEWNIDTCDGNGPSGYHIDPTKMQMIGIQFSWYGAGFIDWMLRGPTGDYLFCHRLKGNNLNNEAYMRTGNLPVRYEVLNEGSNGRLASSMNLLSTTIPLEDASNFPNSGVVYIDNELISFSGKSGNNLTGITRSATYTNFAAGSARSYKAGPNSTHAAKSGVVLISCTASPIISHWGSAYLIDGNFDDDRGFIFNYQAAEISLTTTKKTVFLIRLAPSVSNSVIGDLGDRELINRAQLLLQGIEITGGTSGAVGSMVLEGILNPQNYPTNPADITWTSLNSSALGGQPSFAQVASGGTVAWTTGTTVITAATTNFNRQRGQIDLYFSTNTVSGVVVGQTVSGNNIAGGSLVQSKTDNAPFVGVTRILISQALTGTVNIGTNITFTAASAALPGQTIFSLIAAPGGSSSLDLSKLNELTNTTIGGRGTFPNGPDVLAINAYLTGGTGYNASINLRWGEAQA